MIRYGDDVNVGYFETTKLPSGRTVKIEFQEEFSKGKYYYGIYLAIYHKRKQEQDTVLEITGKDGLKGLLWAKNKIIDFEKFIKDVHGKNIPVTIYCFWDCNRRRNIYERGLKNIGYKFNSLGSRKVLCKTI